MRLACAVTAACLMIRTAAADEFPYSAQVVHEAALVRCGPGETYYPTGRLLRGSPVEVHRHDPHGWCAIRPPDGEFSLIAAEQVKMLPGDDLGEVSAEEATVWVGSQVAKPDEPRWQIHLQRGERVAVMGVRTGESPDSGKGTWYKIAPPAGEFRWIHRDALGPLKPATVEAPPPEVESAPPDAEAAPVAGNVVLDESVTTPVEPPVEVATAVMNAAPDASPAVLIIAEGEAKPLLPPDAMSQELPGPATLDQAVETASFQTMVHEPPSAHDTINVPPPTPAFAAAERGIEPSPQQPVDLKDAETPSPDNPPPTPFDDELVAIHLDLTLEVAKDLGQWRLGPLQERAERLQNRAHTGEERHRAETLAQSIVHFEGLYQRYRKLAMRMR